MTYKQLLEVLDELEPDQLKLNVTAFIDEEFFPIINLKFNDSQEDDRLEEGHPYLEIE
jgi:hypothetical protein